MKRVLYAGESFLTTDSVADALTEITVALARAQSVEAVDLPSVDIDGRAQMVRMVIGPASQLATMSSRTAVEDSVIEQSIHEDAAPQLLARIRALRVGQAATRTPRTGHEIDLDDLDFL